MIDDDSQQLTCLIVARALFFVQALDEKKKKKKKNAKTQGRRKEEKEEKRRVAESQRRREEEKFFLRVSASLRLCVFLLPCTLRPPASVFFFFLLIDVKACFTVNSEAFLPYFTSFHSVLKVLCTMSDDSLPSHHIFRPAFSGLYTALITPFIRGKDIIDEEGFLRLLDRQKAAKVNGILLLGTTGRGNSTHAR